MELKQLFHKYKEKVTTVWKTGKIQRSSRMTYDISWNIILFFLIIGGIGLFFAGGVGAGYFASLVKDEPVRGYESMEKDIYNYEETTRLYFAGNHYFGDIQSEIYREETSLDKVSDTLINAVIATEDEYFKEHKGIVPKAIVRAVYQEATNSSVKSGGSTLTQQLIKNQILTNEVSFERKAKEIVLALRLERFFEKDEILEAYLNIIPYGREASGGNIAGIETAAKGIFGINAGEVNLPQAAFLAGLPQSPSAYTPFVNTGGLKDEDGLQPGINRMKSVLNRMYESEFINKEQYEKALDYDIVADFIEETKSTREKYPYLTYEIEEKARNILMERLAKEDGYTMEDIESDEELEGQYWILADRELRMKGYKIHSTIDKEVYDTFQKVVKKYQYYGPDKTVKEKDPDTGKMVEKVEPIQTGAILIENSTGRIISFVGGREYSLENQLNYATDAKRPTGSTIKPLLYGAAMEKGVVQPGSVVADVPTASGWPSNYGGGYHGLVSVRRALASSYNVPAVTTYNKIRNENPAEEYLVKMGITSLTAEDKENSSLALGSMKHGITVEENTNAFTTLSNDGQFIDAYIIEKITTNDGEVIYEHESEPVDVFSPQTAYLALDMMRDVIQSGTATYLNSQLKHGGVDWAGKTGTSGDYKDALFVGTNPNVTLGTWIGYDTPSSIQCRGCSLSYSQRNLKLWAELVNSAADIKPELVATKERFKQPEGIVHRSYCAISGMLPSELCKQAGLIRSDIFNAKFVPNKEDDSLIGGDSGALVMVNGEEVIAGPNTPKEFTSGEGLGLKFNPEFIKRKGYDRLGDLSVLFPRTNTELWEKIGFSGSLESSAIKDDGKEPSSPTSLAASKNKLTWKKSSSKDVVGYRIYQASKPGEPFKLIGHAVDTNISFSGDGAIFHVKAVDYFGLESTGSKEIIVGDFLNPEEEKAEKEKEKEKAEKEKEKAEKEKEDERLRQEKEKKKKEEEKKEEENNENTEEQPENNKGKE